MIRTLTIFCFLINLFGCFWVVVEIFNRDPSNDWKGYADLLDESNSMLYISALYWAITTCATVGYGDIIPRNEYEIAFCLGVMIIGVAAFSFALSDLST